MNPKRNILFVGPHSGRSAQRLQAFRKLGLSIHFINTTTNNDRPELNLSYNLLDKIKHKLGYPTDIISINEKIKKFKTTDSYDFIWIEKVLCLRKSSICHLKKYVSHNKLIFFSEDNMLLKHNHSKHYIKCLPYYDHVITTKSFNCAPDQLPKLGAKNVIYSEQSYCPTEHFNKKSSDDKEEICVGFIGTYEKDRADKMLYLAKNGIIVKVFGSGWQTYKKKHPNLFISNHPIYGDEYREMIHNTKINLCFLRKINHDLHTSRSIEIPACGGFMLAERTSEHEKLFKDNHEAVYFDHSNNTEFLEKVRYYLEHETERNTIASNGHKRCLSGGYSHQERLTNILKKCGITYE